MVWLRKQRSRDFKWLPLWSRESVHLMSGPRSSSDTAVVIDGMVSPFMTHPFLGCQDILSPLRISVPHQASASTAAKGKSAISMKSMFQGQLIVKSAQKNPTETKLCHTPIISKLAFILKTSYMRLCVLLGCSLNITNNLILSNF